MVISGGIERITTRTDSKDRREICKKYRVFKIIKAEHQVPPYYKRGVIWEFYRVVPSCFTML